MTSLFANLKQTLHNVALNIVDALVIETWFIEKEAINDKI